MKDDLKTTTRLPHTRFLLLCLLLLLITAAAALGSGAAAQTTGPLSFVSVSSLSATNGDQITVDVRIDMTAAPAPDDVLGSFSGTLNWDYVPDFDFYRYDCDPDVATRFSYPE